MQFANFYWSKFLPSKYSILLIALLSMLLIFPLFDEEIGGKLLFSFFFLFILVGMFYSLKREKGVILFIVSGLIALSTHLAEMGFKQLHIVSQIVSILFYLYAILLFCKDIYSSKDVTQDILLGSICVYLLIGMCFGLTYMLIQSTVDQSFIHLASHTLISKPSDFNYFSLITLATVGFGDITAHTTIAKSFVMLEGVVGIFYIAVLVARLVSIFNR
jgi:hypothetical protein